MAGRCVIERERGGAGSRHVRNAAMQAGWLEVPSKRGKVLVVSPGTDAEGC